MSLLFLYPCRGKTPFVMHQLENNVNEALQGYFSGNMVNNNDYYKQKWLFWSEEVKQDFQNEKKKFLLMSSKKTIGFKRIYSFVSLFPLRIDFFHRTGHLSTVKISWRLSHRAGSARSRQPSVISHQALVHSCHKSW